MLRNTMSSTHRLTRPDKGHPGAIPVVAMPNSVTPPTWTNNCKSALAAASMRRAPSGMP